VTLLIVAVVLCDFRRLWIKEVLDESRADARRLVKHFTTVRTAVTGDLNFFIRVRCGSHLRIVSGTLTRTATVSMGLFVILVSTRRGQLLLI
jgi:hypothetical protein